MIEMTLGDYEEQVTRKVAAAALHVTPDAIRKAVMSDRKIIVRVDDRGSLVGAYEVKDFGSVDAVL
jgi:hypothetical protein